MSDQTQLADLLMRWEEYREAGHELSAEELCRDCPECIEPLREQIEQLKASDWLFDEDVEAKVAVKTDPVASQPTPANQQSSSGKTFAARQDATYEGTAFLRRRARIYASFLAVMLWAAWVRTLSSDFPIPELRFVVLISISVIAAVLHLPLHYESSGFESWRRLCSTPSRYNY